MRNDRQHLPNRVGGPHKDRIRVGSQIKKTKEEIEKGKQQEKEEEKEEE